MIDSLLTNLPVVLGQAEAAASGSNIMMEKIALILPEIVLFVGACAVMMLGLSRTHAVRQFCAPMSAIALVVAGIFAATSTVEITNHPFPHMMSFAKGIIAIIGVMVVLLLSGTVDTAYEKLVGAGKVPFEAIRTTRGEFYAFFLFSMMGLMLVASADDLIWLFLALELTSLPTYVMVSISTSKTRSMEAGVKYFFLGAFGAATFLLGFVLLYGAAGTTALFGTASDPGIREAIAATYAVSGSIGPIATVGLVLALVGMMFKIAAVPMHFYTADVYQGASATVSAMLAFVPKAAGFIAIITILAAVGWNYGGAEGEAGHALPEVVRVLLWVLAVLTMIVGNVLALLQNSVKRILAYSSVAHSGYMIVGLIAGPLAGGSDNLAANGVGATLFYLLCYGVMNIGTFAVVASLERNGDEIDSVDDLRGLCATRPLLGYSMVLCSLSLLGLPPILGFWGKMVLFTSAVSAGEIALVVLMGVASAISAFYYLRIASAPFLSAATEREQAISVTPVGVRIIAAVVSAGGVLVLIPFAGLLMNAADQAGTTPVEVIESDAGDVLELPEAVSVIEEVEATDPREL